MQSGDNRWGRLPHDAELKECCAFDPLFGTRPKDALAGARYWRPSADWISDADMESAVEEFLEANRPVIANVTLSALTYYPESPENDSCWHSVLIIGLGRRYVYLHDPDPVHGGPNRRVERSHFFGQWERHGHSMYHL